MKKALFCLMILAFCISAEQKVLTNKDVLALTRCGIDQNFLVHLVKTYENSNFEVATNFLYALQAEGVDGKVTEAMFQREWPKIKERLDRDYEEAQLRKLLHQ